MKTRYKVMNADMTTPFKGMKLELGQEYVCNDFCEDKSRDCAAGFYATDPEGLAYAWKPGRKIIKVQVSGRSIEIPPYKCRYEKIKLIRELSKTEIIRLLKTHEKKCGYLLSEVIFPVNPLEMDPEVTPEDVGLVEKWAKVRDQVGDQVWAYIGTLFPKIKEWKYFEGTSDGYPYQPAADLWRKGLIPVKYRGKWHLLGGPKMKELWKED